MNMPHGEVRQGERPSPVRMCFQRHWDEEKILPGREEALKSKGRNTILLVDDESMQLELIGMMLSRLGFTVLEARDGAEAIDMFLHHHDSICCVLCDVIMPHMDGWETLETIRGHAPDFPVILSSGCDRAQVFAGDHPELPQAFLEKPYGLKELREAIFLVTANKNRF